MKLKIKVPATTANLGCGFDCLGISLKLYNELEIETGNRNNSNQPLFEIIGEGKEKLLKNENNIILKAMNEVFKINRKKDFKKYILKITSKNNIPLARGLGSSASAYLSGLIGANILTNNKLSDRQIIEMAIKFEGHPDNVIPAFYGGLCLCYKENNRINWIKIDNVLDKLKAIICIPDFELETKKARKVLPQKIKLENCVFNVSRIGLLIYSILKKKYNLLFESMNDKLHQPYRAELVPGLYEIFKKSKGKGVLGIALSGSGPSIFAISEPSKANFIGKTIVNIWKKYKINSYFIILDFDFTGTVTIKH